MSLNLDPTVIGPTDLLTLHDQYPISQQPTIPGITPDLFSTYLIPAGGVVLLRDAPVQQQLTIPTGTTASQVPGGPFAEVFGAPAPGEFAVDYVSGTVAFNLADVGKTVLVSFTSRGSVIRAEHINNITRPLVPFYNKLNGIVPDGGTDFTFPANVTVTGNLDVLGTVSSTVTEVINVKDQIILLNQNVPSDTGFVGLEISLGNNPQGSLTNPQFLWKEADSTWNFYSTSGGPTGTRGPLFKVYDKGGVQLTQLTSVEETTLVATLLSGDAGLIWFNTTDSQAKLWNGSAVVIMG